jgi:heptaprenylglyceryl phosphate synthase
MLKLTMTERADKPFFAGESNSEFLRGNRFTRLGIIIDPIKQDPWTAAAKTRRFVNQGGDALFIGGSGYIGKNLFEDTVDAVLSASRDVVPSYILPGHLEQFYFKNRAVTGVLNYREILGASGTPFDSLYPTEDRESVMKSLRKRGIADIGTLYILCGDPSSSVSKVTGITPLDLNQEETRIDFLNKMADWLKKEFECVYFEAGSNGKKPIDKKIVSMIHELAESLSPESAIMVSGGINTPEQAAEYKGIADYVIIGGHFERNGAGDVNDFVTALKK